uniref:Uncharacterized protein n=1 Tax=Oryctolagus cuniculus TaxID=9986 RepID=A0A5F9CQW5_RABIT
TRILFYDGVLHVGCFHYVTYSHGARQAHGGEACFQCVLLFSEALWLSFECDSSEARGHSVGRSLGDVHMRASVPIWPWGDRVVFLGEFARLCTPPLSVVEWSFPLIKREDGSGSHEKRKPQHPLEVGSLPWQKISESRSLPASAP